MFAALAGACAADATVAPAPATPPRAAPAAPRNLFAELLGKSPAEVRAKIAGAHAQLFHGDRRTEAVYFPVGADQAYIADIGSEDVRSEGMSYGMMIAVQLDRRDEFDRLWRWAKAHMQHTRGPRAGYFAWQCSFDGRQLDPNSASDGEEWFAMSLLFAAHRWPAAAGSHDYAADAQALLDAMRRDDRGDGVTSIFHREHRQVVFVPVKSAARLTDPSYHLPAFTEFWARWDRDPAGRAFWREVTDTSRAMLRKFAHPKTGLMPEYANFDGTPFASTEFGAGKGDFRFDAWRTPANVGIDHAWWAADPWQREQSNRVLRFLGAQRPKISNQYTLAGASLSADESIGLIATAAVAGHAADAALARPFVQRLWDAPPPAGKWRYYDGLLYLLALLQVSGEFRVHEAASATIAPSLPGH